VPNWPANSARQCWLQAEARCCWPVSMVVSRSWMPNAWPSSSSGLPRGETGLATPWLLRRQLAGRAVSPSADVVVRRPATEGRPGRAARPGRCLGCRLWGPSQLLVADRINRVSRYGCPTADWNSDARHPTTMESVYRYVIQPSMPCSQTQRDGQFDHLSVDGARNHGHASGPEGRSELGADQDRPVAPVWSSLAFVAVTLAAACVYLQRQDF